MIKEIKNTILLFLLLSCITGFLYPFAMTLLAQIFFPWQAQGSLIMRQDEVIGSAQIGQFFSSERYFWGRPSATPHYPYNPMSSAGSNLGPSNPKLRSRITAQMKMMAKTFSSKPIPIDLVTASGSGLDPDISPEAAFYQVSRIAKVRKLSEKILNQLVYQHIASRTWRLFGEPRVNVLALNLALDQLAYPNLVSQPSEDNVVQAISHAQKRF